MRRARGFAVVTALSVMLIIFCLVTALLLRARQDLQWTVLDAERTRRTYLARGITAELLSELRETSKLPATISREQDGLSLTGTVRPSPDDETAFLVEGRVHPIGNPSNPVSATRVLRRTEMQPKRIFVQAPTSELPNNAYPTIFTFDGPGMPWERLPPITRTNDPNTGAFPRMVERITSDHLGNLYVLYPKDRNKPGEEFLVMSIHQMEQDWGDWVEFASIKTDLDKLGPIASDGDKFFFVHGESFDRISKFNTDSSQVLELSAPGGKIEDLFVSTQLLEGGAPALVATVNQELHYLSGTQWRIMPRAPDASFNQNGDMLEGTTPETVDFMAGSPQGIFGLRELEGVDSLYKLENGEWQLQAPLDNVFEEDGAVKREAGFADDISGLSADSEGTVSAQISTPRGTASVDLSQEQPLSKPPREYYVDDPNKPGSVILKKDGGLFRNTTIVASGGPADFTIVEFIEELSF